MSACGPVSRIFLSISILFLIASPAMAITNPAATYCQALGDQYQIVKQDDGSEAGFCKLRDGSSVDAWKFLLGLEAQDSGYCAQRGYSTEVVSDPKFCQKFMTDQCAACALENGELVEVTRLMNLSFGEDRCNDGVCGLRENTGNCPRDCPSGERDGYCDGQRDGKCDPDCQGAADPDCPEKGGQSSSKGTESSIIGSPIMKPALIEPGLTEPSKIEPAMMEPATGIIGPGNKSDLKAIRLVTGEASFDPEGSVARIPVWLRIENGGLASSGAFKLSIDVIESSGRRYTVPFAVQDQENLWYPMIADLSGQSQIDIGGEVTLGQPSGPDLRGQGFTLVAKVDSCSGDEFMPGYCRVEESDESNNEIETNIAI
jgi:putative hemolysin